MIKEKVKQIIESIVSTSVDEDVTDMVRSGFIDSFDVLRLIVELEKEFSISINLENDVEKKFYSIDSISALIENEKK